ncbi:hypothetical protein [Fibrobacter sp.]|uniref:hypothetical protein n=1 Tax=Fibrobacter sp. TaxID=35828 RepID=UPI003862EC9A
MKSLFSILSVAFFLVACGGKGSTDASVDSSQDSKEPSMTSRYPCKAALEGVIAYLVQEKAAYICNDELWVPYNDAEMLSKFENMPACNDSDKVAAAIERTNHTTIVCHDRDWFFGDE